MHSSLHLRPLQVAEELQQLFRLLRAYGCGDWIVFDASIMRGLAYYTGECTATWQVIPLHGKWWHVVPNMAAAALANTAAMYMCYIGL